MTEYVVWEPATMGSSGRGPYHSSPRPHLNGAVILMGEEKTPETFKEHFPCFECYPDGDPDYRRWREVDGGVTQICRCSSPGCIKARDIWGEEE